MEARVIIVSAKKSNKSENTVWAVAITGEDQPQAYCKSAYKAMRFAFMLKKRTGLSISDNCLSRLSKEIAGQKSVKAAEMQEKVQEVVEEFCEAHSVDNVLAQKQEPQAEQPKKKARKVRASESKDNARNGSAERSRTSTKSVPRAKKSAQVVALQ